MLKNDQNNTLSVKHSYASGDLVTLLPGLRHIYLKTGKKWVIYQQIDFKAYYYDGAIASTVDQNGEAVTMNQTQFDLLKPLIEYQEYIAEFRPWKGEKVHINIDKSRDSKTVPTPYSPLHFWPFFIAPELACNLSDSWVDVPHGTVSPRNIVINRTERYNNPYLHYYFLKPFENQIEFVGTSKEHAEFCSKWELNIPHRQVKDFLELASIIDSCHFFIGNQSMCWHIADALKTPRILEVCSQFPNTFPNGADGYAVLFQEALELTFHQLYNKKQLS